MLHSQFALAEFFVICAYRISATETKHLSTQCVVFDQHEFILNQMTCTKIYLFRVKIAMKAKLKYSTNLRIWATKLVFCSFYLNSVAFFRCNGIFALVHFVLRPFDVTIIVSSFFAQMINRIQYHTIDRPVPF